MDQTNDRTEIFFQYTRQRLIALFVIVILLGSSSLALMIAPTHEIWRTASYVALGAVAIALLVLVPISMRRRRWSPDSPEVKVVMDDEWRRTNLERASRIALIAVLALQYPLVMLYGFAMRLPAPRGAFAMAATTITLGLAIMMGLFLYLDRE